MTDHWSTIGGDYPGPIFGNGTFCKTFFSCFKNKWKKSHYFYILWSHFFSLSLTDGKWSWKDTDSFRFWAISFIKSLVILIINFGLVICSSSANNVVLTRNMTGRRTKLPCPRPDTESLSLWNLLCKNIGKDLSQVSMPVALNEPLNMLQVGCLFLHQLYFIFTKDLCAEESFKNKDWDY